MKQRYFASLLLLAAASTAQAQDYRPFRAGLTYQYSEAGTPGDTTHTLRLSAGTRVGADSVFRFNALASAVARSSNSCGATHVQRRDNLFGATLTVAGRDFILTASNGRSLTLRPHAAVGQPWTAMPGVTAAVQSRGVAAVLGQQDSVVSIALSSGPTLQLSKRHGLVQGPAVLALLNGHFQPRQLTLTALPEWGLGRRRIDAKTVFDFQPGDVFLRHYTTEVSFNMLCQVAWQRDSVISRSANAAGDSVTYVIWTRRLSRGYGAPGAPSGFCSSPTGTFLSPPSTYTLVVSAGMPFFLSGLTNYFEPGNQPISQSLTRAIARSAHYNGRFVQSAMNRRPCGSLTADSIALGDVIDYFTSNTYGEGLGMTSSLTSSFGDPSTMELVWYQKGTETWGQPRTFAQLLPTVQARAAATTNAFPNPFTQELAVTFELSRPQAVAVDLRDALGRVVFTRPATALATGKQTLPLQAAALPAGAYSLHLRFLTEGRSEVLKVLKAQ